MILLEAENISYIIDKKNFLNKTKEKTHILSNISFKLEQGKILGIAGESGSGKTTLSKIIAGVIKPTDGILKFNFNANWRNTKTNPVQILFQNSVEILNPFRKIDEMVEEAIRIRFGRNNEISREKEKIFNSVNFSQNLWKRKGSELSGGEQQRAALARILAVQPELLILDEPFSAQDPESQKKFLELFRHINKEYKLTFIVVAHNLKILRELADEILILYNGEIVEKGNSTGIFNNPHHPYTKFLLRAENYDLNYNELRNKNF